MAFGLRRAFVLGAMSLTLAGAARSQPAAHGEWTGIWGASPLPPTLVAAAFAPVSPSFDNQTLRQVVRVDGGGNACSRANSNLVGSIAIIHANPLKYSS